MDLKILIVGLLASSSLFADQSVTMHMVDKNGVAKEIGEVVIADTKYGAVFAPKLKNLSPGIHGFHVHQNASCDAAKKGDAIVPGLAAGGHFDPENTKKHDSPWGSGHLGDLPPLYVEDNGIASQPVLAPRVKLKDIVGRALMIHAGGDNHSDHPKPLGGGGARVACGIIK